MSKQTFTLRYLSKTAVGVPRDLAKTAIAQFRPIRPTVLIFHCTFVCDARCEMCSNWKRGNRKEDMTLAQIDRVMHDPFWKDIENLNISGGEPTTRNDLVEIVELIDKGFPTLRKLGINTTGLTPHRAIPMLTQDREVLRRARRDLQHPRLDRRRRRHARRGAQREARLREGRPDHRGDAGAAAETPGFNFGISSTIFSTNLDDATTSWRGRASASSTSSSTWCASPTPCWATQLEESIGFRPREEEYMRKFFLDRVRQDPLLDGQNYIYMHYADMIANGYHRTTPCPFKTQGIMLNPNGDLFFCENSR